MKRGDVYTARLEPVEGSEQGGTRPVVIVSNDGLNSHAPFVLAVPCTTYRGKRLTPSQLILRAGEGNLSRDSVALCEQVRVLSKTRFGRQWGTLGRATLAEVDDKLRVAFFLEP